MALVIAATAVSATGLSIPVANAQPAGFPDVDSFPAVDPADYRVDGAHPSLSGWMFRTLPTGTKFDAGNGVVCAVPADDAFACRAQKPDSWPKDTPDPPDRHYGEHGFVVQPSGSWTF